jgi:hypothetical protein
MQFRLMSCAVDQANACESLEYSPIAFAVLFSQPRQVTYAWADSNLLNVADGDENLEIY